MNASSIIQQRPSRLFDLAVYLTLAVLMAVSLIVFPDTLVRVLIIVLCSVFGLIYRFGYYAIRTPRHAAIYFHPSNAGAARLDRAGAHQRCVWPAVLHLGHPGGADIGVAEPQSRGLCSSI